MGSATIAPPAADHAPSKPQGSGPIVWLDALKGIAILAVVADHAFIVDNYLDWKHLYFSVTWFVFLAALTNTISARQRGLSGRSAVLALWSRRLKSLLVPYLAASVLGYLVLSFPHYSLTQLGRELLLFHALPPLYFVALLLQLLAVFPALYWLIYCLRPWGILLALGISVAIVELLSQRLYLPFVLGAHYFLGGTFLFAFLLGMLVAPAMVAGAPRFRAWITLCLPAFVWAEYVLITTNGALMTHPPTNIQLVYSISLLGICYAALSAFPDAAITRLLAYLGRRSMEIFLYHYIFLLPILAYRHTAWTGRLPLVQGQLVLMAVAIPGATVASILAAAVLRAVGRALLEEPARWYAGRRLPSFKRIAWPRGIGAD